MKRFMQQVLIYTISLAFAIPIFVVVFFAAAVLTGYVIACLWQWFVPWLEPISLAHACGLAMLVRVFSPPTYVPMKPGKESWTNVGRAFFIPVGSLITGWIIHTYFS